VVSGEFAGARGALARKDVECAGQKSVVHSLVLSHLSSVFPQNAASFANVLNARFGSSEGIFFFDGKGEFWTESRFFTQDEVFHEISNEKPKYCSLNLVASLMENE
jgi:hypothetical protein